MKKKLSEKYFKSVYTKVPRVCVEIVIIQRNNLLLTKRSIAPFKDFWHFPGGGVLFREKINDTVKRVAREELGVEVIPQKFLGYLEILKDGFRHSVSLTFKCKINKGQQPKTLKQADEFKFFNKIPKKTVPDHKRFIKINLKRFLDKK